MNERWLFTQYVLLALKSRPFHEYTPSNTYTAPGTGHRSCRTCRNIVEANRAPRRATTMTRKAV